MQTHFFFIFLFRLVINITCCFIISAVLTLYLINILLYDDDSATMIYHVFTMACYFTPILGAILADSLLGKYKTILHISILHAVGNIVLALASIPNFLPMAVISMIGLFMVAAGTGGIKPCVSAFGGDQFGPGQERDLQRFFSFFYLSINAGSLLSTFLTPILRADVTCFGDDTCYSLAFGIPAVLMVVALILFIVGRPLYKMFPPQGNILIKVVKCIIHALKRRIRARSEGITKDHWLNYADDMYDTQLIEDVKAILWVLLLFIPLPVFWALYDQQGSRWTLQAIQMDGQLGGFIMKPDQMQVINPFLIIIFIPLFEYIIYPLFAKCNLLIRPLQRITLGGLLTAISFVIAGFLQIRIENTLPVIPSSGFSQVALINTAPCSVSIKSDILETKLAFNQMYVVKDIKSGVPHNLTFTPAPGECEVQLASIDYVIQTASKGIHVLMVTSDLSKLLIHQVTDSLEKPENGDSNIRILYSFPSNLNTLVSNNGTFKLSGPNDYELPIQNSSILYDTSEAVGSTEYTRVLSGVYSLHLPVANSSEFSVKLPSFELKMGGGYILTVAPDKTFEATDILCAGEIMFSITGLEFSYSQAPSSMKSVLQAAWLLTVAFGNLIVVVIAELHLFDKQSLEFFMFAGLMGVDMLIFAVMAYFYKYVDQPQEGDEYLESTQKDNKSYREVNCIQNEGFLEDTKM
ncbi:solute carrier family 15 member 1-like [Limulus polyphemus]|uniref:Solute carrier family 15 member 1-like n=1 Tax=Limulus polyphemus TaxID=6850 RepID=A0ABM1TQN3_LIMPO|nr:solute carrier family 15 member 1-like [Limulus polyphemus]